MTRASITSIAGVALGCVLVVACATTSRSQERTSSLEKKKKAAPSKKAESTGETSDVFASDVEGGEMTETVETAFRAFQQSSLAPKVTVGGAVVAYLAGRALEKPGIRVRTWSGRRLDDHRFRFEMGWAKARPRETKTDEDKSEPPPPETTSVVFEYDLKRDDVAADSPEARAVVEWAKDFDPPGEPLRVLPNHFHPNAETREGLWTGNASKACKAEEFRDNCLAMESFFARCTLIDAMRWLMTAVVDDHETYRTIKSRGDCKWDIVSPIPKGFFPKPKEWATHRIAYTCPHLKMKWDVDREDGRMLPLGRQARLITVIGELNATPATARGSFGNIRRAFGGS